MSRGPYHGIYPGKVENNLDPLAMARILVSVADVGGSSVLSWALPCLPVTGTGMGMFTAPPIGAGVWVAFVRGDADYPVWMGGYYGSGEAPSLSRNVPPGLSGITLQTSGGHGLVINDAPGGGILIQTIGGAKISVTDSGITISTGQGATLSLQGNTVDVNSGALTVK
jgi:uncharacterized protein involved in type VI secretion and phage assembly